MMAKIDREIKQNRIEQTLQSILKQIGGEYYCLTDGLKSLLLDCQLNVKSCGNLLKLLPDHMKVYHSICESNDKNREIKRDHQQRKIEELIFKAVSIQERLATTLRFIINNDSKLIRNFHDAKNQKKRAL